MLWPSQPAFESALVALATWVITKDTFNLSKYGGNTKEKLVQIFVKFFQPFFKQVFLGSLQVTP